jgi:septum formation protein
VRPPHLVLASASPRRFELLAVLGVVPEVRPAQVDESPSAGELAGELTVRLAVAKATAVAAPGELVVGADTEVVVDGAVLGKPADPGDGARMLGRLSGRRHEVVSGVAVVLDGRVVTAVERTGVRFRTLDEADLAWYAATGEGADKAGGYGIQGAASLFVAGIEGSYPNVVGLPVAAVDDLCRQLGWPLRTWSAATGTGAGGAPAGGVSPGGARRRR